MRYLVRSITGVNGKGQEQLRKMQIPYKELVDADGNLKDISKVIEVIAEVLKRQQASGMDKSVFYSLVFGTRGSRAIDALIADYMRGGPNVSIYNVCALCGVKRISAKLKFPVTVLFGKFKNMLWRVVSLGTSYRNAHTC